MTFFKEWGRAERVDRDNMKAPNFSDMSDVTFCNYVCSIVMAIHTKITKSDGKHRAIWEVTWKGPYHILLHFTKF
jgi:hypothetical protein